MFPAGVALDCSFCLGVLPDVDWTGVVSGWEVSGVVDWGGVVSCVVKGTGGILLMRSACA